MDRMQELIDEQKKLQKLVQLAIDSGTLEKFVENVAPESGNEDIELDYDPWSFEDTHTTAMSRASYHLQKAFEHLTRLKFWVNYTDELYNGRVAEWEAVRGKTKYGAPLGRGKWLTYYTNPECLKFFEDYENFKGIEKSIYKSYKKITANRNNKKGK